MALISRRSCIGVGAVFLISVCRIALADGDPPPDFSDGNAVRAAIVKMNEACLSG